jgi:hypothetical protein
LNLNSGAVICGRENIPRPMKALSSLTLGLALAAVEVAPLADDKVPFAARRTLGLNLLFHAPFDESADATFAKGDKRIHWGPQWGAPRVVQPGLPPGGVSLAFQQGRYGSALRFDRPIKEVVAFKAAGNMPYRQRNWQGSVSFWLRVSPDEDLEPGYCDPIQITPKAWDNAAFFTEFTKDDKPREFRFGAYADPACWNPQKRKWEDMPLAEKPLVPVLRPPFSRDRWTHVVFTWEKFNSGKPDGVARLYVDGGLKGELSPREQTWTWNIDETFVMLGLSYTGWMDDLAIFGKALSLKEVNALRNLPKGVAGLHD